MKVESQRVYTKRKKNGMYGLFADDTFLAHTVVLDIGSGDRNDVRDFRSIELEDGHYTHPDGMFVNHSCDPNTYVDRFSGELIAVHRIHPGDEITFNYLESEREIAGPFDCNCGAENCVGRIER